MLEIVAEALGSKPTIPGKLCALRRLHKAGTITDDELAASIKAISPQCEGCTKTIDITTGKAYRRFHSKECAIQFNARKRTGLTVTRRWHGTAGVRGAYAKYQDGV